MSDTPEPFEQIQQMVLADVLKERQRQDLKWGGHAHDSKHTISDWVNFIHEHADKARAAARQTEPYGARKRLIETAALAVASVEALDRIIAYNEGLGGLNEARKRREEKKHSE